jgi:hypothetical protein
LAAAFGVAGGYLAAFAIEALHRGFPFESAWKWQFRRGRVPATNYAAVYGLLGGVVASALSTSLDVFKGWARREREDADHESQSAVRLGH